ncbi:hypothetical protein [Sulfurovum mangrovi]|uniref:hypothetical protein n=1 Tax=Sulfurovum mangrovi TaxID=2893889 RepID=UPI001E377A83|nr:hypothetical protein [Sulfurovum mangrovi]UFH58859.1 hypothetical protein LN246_10970 [Sulfurovum mangrovi]
MIVLIEGKMFGGYQKPDFTNKETGETTKGKYIVQLMTEQKLQNDEIKNELMDVSIPAELVSKYKGKEGQTIQIKCNYMAKEKVTFYGVL